MGIRRHSKVIETMPHFSDLLGRSMAFSQIQILRLIVQYPSVFYLTIVINWYKSLVYLFGGYPWSQKKCSNLLGDSESDSLFVCSQPPMGTKSRGTTPLPWAMAWAKLVKSPVKAWRSPVEALMRPVVFGWFFFYIFLRSMLEKIWKGTNFWGFQNLMISFFSISSPNSRFQD